MSPSSGMSRSARLSSRSSEHLELKDIVSWDGSLNVARAQTVQVSFRDSHMMPVYDPGNTLHPSNAADALPASPSSPTARRFLIGSDEEYEREDITKLGGWQSVLHFESARSTGLGRTTPIFSQVTMPTSVPAMSNESQDLQAIGVASEQGSTMISNNMKDTGLSFDELVDKLLSQPMSKGDAKFAAVFLCLYRKFSAPAELLSAITCRFESLDNENEAQILRISSQLRHLAILAQWINEYPGDFAHPATYQTMSDFILKIASIRMFTIAAKEMSTQLDEVFEDDDTEWACSDSNSGVESTAEDSFGTTSIKSMVSAADPNPLHEISNKDITDTTTQHEPRIWSARHSKTPSNSSSTGRSGSQSAGSSQTLTNSFEAAQSQAQLLAPVTRIPLSKVQWHQFIDIPNEAIARELTRIDWIMFSSIRPRDLVRHVSLSVEQKDRCRSLQYVNRMISHFNHVAFWVANIILLRDKAKHRAQALEKFMSLAWVIHISMFPNSNC